MIMALFFSACAITAPVATPSKVAPRPTQAPPSLTPLAPRPATQTPRPTFTTIPSATPPPSITPFTLSRDPIYQEFQSEDGILLKGYFFPAAHRNAPLVIFMHQTHGDQTMWWAEGNAIIPWLQNWPREDGTYPTYGEKLPRLPKEASFNVFTFDFRGHGISGGSKPSNPAEYLKDARAAYRFAAGLPLVDGGRVVGIGASIGADAVVDACADNCRGAFAISPGSWLKMDYTFQVKTLINQGKHVRCIYSSNDTPSPETCWSVEPGPQYQIFSYTGLKHGMTFFVPRKMPDDFGKNIADFLFASTQQGQAP